jgi:hypothetical protein
MNIITKLLFAFTLSISLPTFCMDFMDLAEDMPAETIVLDDGNAWVNPQNGRELAPFAGKLVACRSEGLRAGFGHANLYKIDRDNPTGYALISAWRHGSFSDYDGDICHRLYTCPHTQVRVGNGGVSIPLTTIELERTPWLLRLPTYNEICHLSKALKNGQMRCYTFNDFETASQLLKPFTLENVLEEDRILYFKKQTLKNMWQWQRLLHIGKRDSGSQLYRLPKDMINLLTKHTFDAQVQELASNADPDQILDLE